MPIGNPALPPSLAAEFRALSERISALERGERSVTYRERLPVNDASVGRISFSKDGDRDVYSAALVNPKYPVFVARYHVLLFGAGTADTYLKASLSGSQTQSRRISLSGKVAPERWTFHTIEIAWLHRMNLDEWQDTETTSAARRGNIEIHFHVTADQLWFNRNPSLEDNLRQVGFTDAQNQALRLWFSTYENKYESYFREPEYAFLAPLNAFPTATPEGTLLPGTVIDI